MGYDTDTQYTTIEFENLWKTMLPKVRPEATVMKSNDAIVSP